MAIRTDTVYCVREEDENGMWIEGTSVSYAVTNDGEGMYWYDSVPELLEDRGEYEVEGFPGTVRRMQHLSSEALDTLRYGPRE